MVSIRWCLNIKNGIELIEPNDNMSDSYLKMAEESLQIIRKIDESKLWTASASYYVMYYSLYSVMMKIGVKCEVHQCSIEFMKQYLLNFYNSQEVNLIKKGFDVRNDLQYYPGKLVDKDKLEFVKNGAVDFFIKTKEILPKITEKQINQIRSLLEKEKNGEKEDG